MWESYLPAADAVLAAIGWREQDAIPMLTPYPVKPR
jgi:hypothetical protein